MLERFPTPNPARRPSPYHGSPMARNRGARRVERAAIWAFVPVVAMAPFCLLALAVLWRRSVVAPHRPGRSGGWRAFLAAVCLLFVRPFQVRCSRRCSAPAARNPLEAERIASAWDGSPRRTDLPPERYVVRVLPSDELNAFACGGHLVVVTSFAVDASCRPMPSCAACSPHELSHHLGLHTVAITIGHWMSVPVVVLAGSASSSRTWRRPQPTGFGRRSPVIEVLGQPVAAIYPCAVVGLHRCATSGRCARQLRRPLIEFEADKRAVDMGFGPELASALAPGARPGLGWTPIGWRARLAASHPAARTASHGSKHCSVTRRARRPLTRRPLLRRPWLRRPLAGHRVRHDVDAAAIGDSSGDRRLKR